METQLKKGLLDVIVLAALNRGDSYGYKIVQDVSKLYEISESTLYPILRRLEVQGCLESYSKEYNGRLRKYYSLTAKGAARIIEFKSEWKQIKAIFDFIDDPY